MGATHFDESRATMRTQYLIALLLTAGIGVSQTSDNQPVSCVGCFSEPQSTLLFRKAYIEPGKLNDELYLVTPSGSITMPELHGRVGQGASPIPAISPSGDRVAWSLKFMLNSDIVKCDSSQKYWCDLKPKPIYKSVMGVYSVRDRTWKQYGDFETVGSAAFSPDGNKVAFTMNRGCTVTICDKGLMILDLETGQMKPVPGPGSNSVFWITQLSWSPDGNFLAGTVQGPGGRLISEQIVVIDIATGAVKTIAEGSDPSWSPEGDWIAYAWTVQCMIIHPDGTGARSVLDKEHKWMNYPLDPPIVWSPDGERLLLNQQKFLGGHNRVIMVDLATGHVIRKSKDGEVVSGWVPYSGK
jgi:Tol biopolymer transport system component